MNKAVNMPPQVDRPGWIPAHIKDDWDTDPYAYMTFDEFPPGSSFHNDLMYYWFIDVLKLFLQQREQKLLPDVLMLYQDENGVKQRIAPDLNLVSLSNGLVEYYDLDQHPPPRFIIEIVSPDSRQDDTEKKVKLYERLGVQEYLVVDVVEAEISALYFWRLKSGRLHPVAISDNGVNVQSMGVNIRLHDDELQLVDLANGRRLEDKAMLIKRIEALKQQTEQTKRQADQAEQQIAELKAQLARNEK